MAVEIPQLLGPEFYGFILPWIFTFAIVYGLLIKLNIFGEKKNDKVSAALAFVIAFFVTAVGGPQLAAFFINLFGGTSVFLAGILVVLLFGAMLGRNITDYWAKNEWALAVVVIIAVVLFLASAGGGFLGITLSGDTATLIFAVVIVLVAAHFVMSGKDEGEKPAPKAAGG
ncbi:MAG: hypothetical protein HYW26_03215 [Candidatus Aenigmarchaeota archaeon]|nr:hypothetical protein [Candidatus Aenigmarchaeota archaeon]